jgi:rhamnosyltransferase subunit B
MPNLASNFHYDLALILMARILIVGKGGYGDMFPMLAVAQELKNRGHAISIAAEAHHGPSIRPLGIPLTPTDADSHRRKTNSSGYLANITKLLGKFSSKHIETEYEVVHQAAKDVDLIIGNQVAYTAAIVRKKLGKPWVFCAPSPLAIPSRLDPPLFPYLHGLQSLTRPFGIPPDIYINIAREVSRLNMLSSIRLQRRVGINDNRHPRFEGMYSDDLNLLMTSPALLTHQPDWPAKTFLSGFTWFEPSFLKNAKKSEKLSNFLRSGPPPIVFAPGGSKRIAPGRFYTESIAACKKLGCRGILLAAKRFHDELPVCDDILVIGYTPYAELLDGAAAIVHSGGIGALGWGLKYGVPSVMIPSSWDQYDNARLATQKGIAVTLKSRSFNASELADALRNLRKNTALSARVNLLKPVIVKETGEFFSCEKIEALLR